MRGRTAVVDSRHVDTVARGDFVMCGRYALFSPTKAIMEIFDLTEELVVKPQYNIAPTEDAWCVRMSPRAEREPVQLRWGLVPFWAKDQKMGSRMINARSETVAQKPAFKKAFQQRRCLVLANGFYEWAKLTGSRKQPFFFHLAEKAPFAMAGLWEKWQNSAGERLESFTILTTDANQVVKPHHHRMPVILEPEQHDVWLDHSSFSQDDLTSLLKPYGGDDLVSYAVGRHVNDPRFDDPVCIEPLE